MGSTEFGSWRQGRGERVPPSAPPPGAIATTVHSTGRTRRGAGHGCPPAIASTAPAPRGGGGGRRPGGVGDAGERHTAYPPRGEEAPLRPPPPNGDIHHSPVSGDRPGDNGSGLLSGLKQHTTGVSRARLFPDIATHCPRPRGGGGGARSAGGVGGCRRAAYGYPSRWETRGVQPLGVRGVRVSSEGRAGRPRGRTGSGPAPSPSPFSGNRCQRRSPSTASHRLSP